MICPCCHKPKTSNDFYWRNGWKSDRRCKTCISEQSKKKRNEETLEGLFNIKEFAKFYK